MAEIEGDFVVFLIGARVNNKMQFVRSLLDLRGKRAVSRIRRRAPTRFLFRRRGIAARAVVRGGGPMDHKPPAGPNARTVIGVTTSCCQRW